MAEQAEKRLLTRAEAADYLRISRRFLEMAASRGEGPPMVRIGRLVRYRCTDLQSWIEQNVDHGRRP